MAQRSPQFCKGVGDSFSEFAEQTSAHAIPRAYNSRSCFKKILWLLLFFICFSAFSFQAVLIIQRFLRNDIIVGVEMKFENIPFPSVTVCNLNPYKNSLARTLGPVQDTLQAFDNAIEKSHDMLAGRRKRSTTQQIAVLTTCTLSTDFLYYPSADGMFSCICVQSLQNGHTYECSTTEGWQENYCTGCDLEHGICQMVDKDHPNGYHNTWPCLCKMDYETSSNFCVLQEFDEIHARWPLTLRETSCTCNSTETTLCEPLAQNSISPQRCYCAAPQHGTPYCARITEWYRSKCSECSWEGECLKSYVPQHMLDYQQQCLCHGENKCIAFEEKEVASSTTTTVRVRRQIQRLYEKIFNRFDGLLAVYSICNCDSRNNCQALKDASNGTVCLCFYNRKNSQIWPCYPPKMWAERKCVKCSPLGDCTYSEREGNLPCVCAPVIRMCVRIEEGIAEEVSRYVNESGAGAVQIRDEVEELFVLGNKIPKIWEITTTEMPMPKEIKEKEKETAYGLKGISDPIALKAKANENLVFAVSALNESDKSRLSYTKKEFLTKCSFNGRPCSVENDFSVYIDPTFGNCFTFNYNSSENMTSERAGPSYGLRFQVFVNISGYYLPTTEAAGVRLTVHAPDEQPFPDTHGFSAPTGFVSSFAIRLKRVTRLPQPYGDCRTDVKTDEYIYKDKNYTTEGCQRTCMQRYLCQMCGCGDPRFPPYLHYKNCPVDDAKLRDCLRKEIKNAVRDKCECKQPCSQQVFSVSYSCARYDR
uniref:Degenerin n=1 Tax=Acrobeloides nanus TaxID=290746 RepID=A0A914ELU5_9BILA